MLILARRWPRCRRCRYIAVFLAEEIDYDVLLDVSEADLAAMGIKKLGARRKIIKAIQRVKNPELYLNRSWENESVLSTDSMSSETRSMDTLQYVGNMWCATMCRYRYKPPCPHTWQTSSLSLSLSLSLSSLSLVHRACAARAQHEPESCLLM